MDSVVFMSETWKQYAAMERIDVDIIRKKHYAAVKRPAICHE